ncbi:MAG: hypothetical protein IPG58_06620 [Acidobacteria bacterium]|nr:hypothetical protein [Acidobacteriota bacterium]
MIEFEVIYASTREELYEQAKTRTAEGWNLQGDAGIAQAEYGAGANAPEFVYFYQVVSKTGQTDLEANRERLLKMAQQFGL